MSGTSTVDNFNFALSPPAPTMFFWVGREFIQTSTIVDSQGNDPISMKSKIVGKVTATVGAGTFHDSIMVQHEIQIQGSDPSSYIVYEWYAPFVGKIVSIRSKDKETNDLFSVAEIFERMKICKML